MQSKNITLNEAQNTRPSNAYGLFTILFVLVIISGYGIVYMTGHTLIVKNDDLGQYYETFLYTGAYLKRLLSGGSLLLYDLSIGVGEGIIECLNYYGFGDPFYLISIFASKNNAHILFNILYYLRLYLGGMAFIFYCRQMRLSPLPSAVSALSYILASFGLSAVSKIPAWGCVLIFLPLFLTGCEMIFKRTFYGEKGKYAEVLLTLTALYAGLCGFYMIYMTGIFMMVYCTMRLYFITQATGRTKAFKKSACVCLYCALWVAAGLLLSAPFLFPAVRAYLSSERSSTGIWSVLLDPHNYLPSLKFIKHTFSYPISGNVYFQGMTVTEFICGALIFLPAGIFLPGAATSPRIRQCRLAVIVSALTFSLPIVGYIFNGFGESYTRWAIFIHFIFAVMTACFLTENQSTHRKKVILVLTIALPLNIIVNAVTYFAPSIGGHVNKLIKTQDLAISVDSPVCHSSVIASDPGLYRISAQHFMPANDRPENVAMLYGYHGLTYWFSMVNGHTQKGVNAMTDKDENWRSYGLYGDISTETMAGVKYYLTASGDADVNYEKAESFTWNGDEWQVYINPRYYGMTYVRRKEDAPTVPTDKAGYDALYDSIYENVIAKNGGFEGSYARDSYRVSVTSDAPGCEAVIAIPYNRDFKIFLDKEPVTASLADGIYTAIDLPDPGQHEIEMIYTGAPFKAGVTAMVVILLMLMTLYGFYRIKNKK